MFHFCTKSHMLRSNISFVTALKAKAKETFHTATINYTSKAYHTPTSKIPRIH